MDSKELAMRCPQCGHEVPAASRFCGECGMNLRMLLQPAVLDLDRAQYLLKSSRYAAVIAGIPETAAPALRELRAEAQRQFDQSVAIMADTYWERYQDKPPTTRRVSKLSGVFRERTPAGIAIDDAFESNTYIAALLARARRILDESQDSGKARAVIYAAQVLPNQQQHTAAIERFLATLDPPSAPAVALPAPEDGAQAELVAQPLIAEQDGERPVPLLPMLQPPSAPDTNGDTPDHVLPTTEPPDNDHFSPLSEVEPVSDPPPASPDPASSDSAQAELKAIEAVEKLINDRADLAQIDAQLAETQALVTPESMYEKRLQRASAQVQVLRDDQPALDALLARPLAEWLERGDQLAQESDAIMERIQAVFDNDAPLVQDWRERRQRRLAEWQNTRDQIAELAQLDGQKLVVQLEALEQLPSDFPQLAQARARRAAYQQALDHAVSEEENRRIRVQQQEQQRILKLELDNRYHELDSDPQQLVAVRDEAEKSSLIDLPAADNPLDAESFAYYDLLFASRYRSLTRPNAKVEQGQTLVGAREYLQAYKLLLEAYAELQHSDDPDARTGTKRALDIAIAELKTDLETDAEVTLHDVDELLARFNYQAAQQNLQAQRGRIDAAEIGIDQRLDQRLREAETQVERLSNRDRQARAQLEQAETSAPIGGANPDFPRALGQLAQAAQLAPWLDVEIGHRSDQFRERRNQFVADRIQRANLVRQNGTDEGFHEAELLLGQAEANASNDAQRAEISQLRGTIIHQQQNRQRQELMLNAAHQLADEAKQGNELELLSARVAAERDRIGPQQTPNVDSSTWAELNGYLTAAEKRIDSWRAFHELISQAEQAAFLGDQKVKDSLVKQLAAMSEHTYLPFQERISRVEQIARQGTKLDRARHLIDKIREDLASNQSEITADRLFQVLHNTSDLDKDPEIAEDRIFLKNILPLYQTRDDLSAALSVGDFANFDQLYSNITAEDIKRSPVVSRLKQQADIARGRASFEQEYQALLRKVRPLFNNGWDDPVGFQEAVDTIRSYAGQTPPALRSEQPRLHADAIDQLDNVASSLASARADNDHYRYQSALARVQAIINDLPLSAISAKNMLGSYASELSFLREIMVRHGERLNAALIYGESLGKAFREAVSAYSDCAGDERRAFRKSELIKAQGMFAAIDAPEYLGRRDTYIATIRDINDLIDRVDAAEEFMISGQNQSDDRQPSQGGLQRRKLAEVELNAILDRSKALRQSSEGVIWRGIQDDPKYRALRANLELAKALGDADEWLSRSKNLNQTYGQLRNLRGDADDLKALNLPGSRDGELTQVGLHRLVEACGERWQEINARLGKMNAATKTIERRRSRAMFWAIGLVLLAALAAGAWQVPSVRSGVSDLVNGIPTPTPTPTIALAPQTVAPIAVVVTATPMPTATPVPTQTPVPPQPGVVIVPGRANVRARPNADLPAVDNVVAGNEVVVTGYAVAPDGTVWYRIDVASRQRSGVWLLAKVPVQGQTFDTVRFDNNATLDPALQVPYAP
jgi:hypothetical protein